MITAVERFRTDLVGGKIPHVANENLSRHILNAQLKETRGGYWLVKGRGENDWIDAAVATVLAYEARMDQLLEGDTEVKKGYAFL
jgi:phage terminase large subunit-like protein